MKRFAYIESRQECSTRRNLNLLPLWMAQEHVVKVAYPVLQLLATLDFEYISGSCDFSFGYKCMHELTKLPSSPVMTVVAALIVAKKVKEGTVVKMRLRAWLTRYPFTRLLQSTMAIAHIISRV